MSNFLIILVILGLLVIFLWMEYERGIWMNARRDKEFSGSLFKYIREKRKYINLGVAMVFITVILFIALLEGNVPMEQSDVYISPMDNFISMLTIFEIIIFVIWL